MRVSFTASDRMAEIAIDYNSARMAVIVAHGKEPVITLNNRPIAGFPPNELGERLRDLFDGLEPVLRGYVIERDRMKRFYMLASIRDRLNQTG